MTSTTSPRTTQQRLDDRPVLAAVVDDASSVEVLHRAAHAAAALGAPLTVALLDPQDGFSTDAALVARRQRESRRRLQDLLTDLQPVTGHPITPTLLPYGWRPPRWRRRLLAGLVAGAARRCGARMVVVPVLLGDAAARLPIPVIVVEPAPPTTENEV